VRDDEAMDRPGEIRMPLEPLRLQSDRRLASVTITCLLAFSLWFLRIDFVRYAHDPALIRDRLILHGGLVAVLVAGLWLLRRVHDRQGYQRIVSGVTITGSAFVLWLNLDALRSSGSAISPILSILALYGGLPNRRWWQCAPPVLLSLGLISLRLWLAHAAAADVVGDVLTLVAVNVIGVVIVVRRTTLEPGEDAAVLAAQVAESALQTLRGFIPICAHCKQVRTDVGDWQEIERYVQEHTAAQFTHGICPSNPVAVVASDCEEPIRELAS
jgi:Co/Zn/Cd efflux system component